MAVHNLPDHKKGDTFDGEIFTLVINDLPVDLTGSIIKMDVRKDKLKEYSLRLSSVTSGISITIPTSGVFQINPQIVDIPPGKYFYDLEITFTTGEVKTYVEGIWTINQDVTYG